MFMYYRIGMGMDLAAKTLLHHQINTGPESRVCTSETRQSMDDDAHEMFGSRGLLVVHCTRSTYDHVTRRGDHQGFL